MKKIFLSIIKILTVVYLLVSIFIFIKQRDFLYFPTYQIKHNFTEESFINDGITIKTTIINKGNKNLIIYFGGNGENVDYNADIFAKIFPTNTIYLIKYRGYSGSMGIATEKNLYSDALYIYDKIKPQYNKISVIGRSLGSGIATYLASKREINRLVLVTPFDSIESIAQEIFPFLPISLLLRDKYKSIERVKFIKSKTLVIQAENDQIVGEEHTKRLVNKFHCSQIIFKEIKNSNHNDISDNKYYYKLLQQFI